MAVDATSNLRVLVADDDGGSRLVLHAAVTRLGHTCSLAIDGDDAWRQFQASPPDVLITDWMMPGVEGPELCRRARQRADGGYTYVILATSLDDHRDVLEAMKSGADDYLTKPVSPLDLRVRLMAAQHVTDLHRTLHQLHGDLAAQARTDALTELGNRLRLHEDLEVMQDRAVRYEQGYCVAICDIDDFKRFNDSYGTEAGDEALRRLGRMLTERSRTGDMAYRYGGEEFVVVLAAQTLPHAMAAMERLRHDVEALAIPHETSRGDDDVLTISVGVAAWGHERLDTPATVLTRADNALYRSKLGGRNRVKAGEPGELFLTE